MFESNMELNHRQVEILSLLQGGQRISVRELAGRFAVSEMTIRRDLNAMEEQRLLVRTYGGASPSASLRSLNNSPLYEVPPAKVAIGKRAAALVKPGQTVMFDTGTTALEVARHLPRDINLTVATTSLCVAQELFGTPITVVLFGGVLRKEFPSLYGPMTEAMVKNFHVDILFIGCDGARSDDGFYTTEVQHSTLEQAMISIADRVVVVTESRKFAQPAFVRYAPISGAHLVITDADLPEKDRRNLEERGVDVVVVE
jgi:DeoR/GlpR family transcriptional regulator of sugar metabolism